jgi:hypothetical protein
VAKARRQRARGNGLTLTRAFGGALALLLGIVMAYGAARAGDMKSPGAWAAPLADRATPVSARLPSCRCTREYKPVCGHAPGGAAQTYANACVAKCDGASGIRSGRC